MNRLQYNGQSYWTGSALAAALLDYVGVLHRTGEEATVELPVRTHDGVTTRATLHLTPGEPLSTLDLGIGDAEVIDERLTDDLRNAARHAG